MKKGIIAIILLIISIILLMYKLIFIACFFILFAIVLFLFVLRQINITPIKERNTYIITHNAIKNPFLKTIIKQCLYKGDFIISNQIIESISNNNTNPIVIDNILYLKKRGLEIKHIDKKIKSLFKYAFENNAIMIISGEKSAKNLSKIFNIRYIDISYFIKTFDIDFENNKEIAFIITKNNDNMSEGYLFSDIKVFCENANLKKGSIYRGYIKNIIDIDGKKQIIAGSKKNED